MRNCPVSEGHWSPWSLLTDERLDLVIVRSVADRVFRGKEAGLEMRTGDLWPYQ